MPNKVQVIFVRQFTKAKRKARKVFSTRGYHERMKTLPEKYKKI